MSKITVQDLTFTYEGSDDAIFEGLSFQLDSDWKLGLIGRNGRGKTTLLKLFQGMYEYRGEISANVDFEYFPFPVADKNARAADVVREISPDYAPWQLARELNLLETSEAILERPFATLSGGEQTKLLLAALFLRENRFLLIDEPTNHLDMAGRAVVSRYLKGKKGFILVSHDRAFLDDCVDHIMAIEREGMTIEQGNFSSWFENKRRRDQFEWQENEKLKGEIGRLKASAKEKSTWSNRKEKSKHRLQDGSKPYDKGYIGHQAAKMMKRSKAIEKRQLAAIEEKASLLKNIERAEALKISQLPFHANPLLRLSKVAIAYGDHLVCEGVDFSIAAGDRIALCGKNGSGKSSVLKLICGEPIPFRGTLEKSAQLKISYVSQESGHLAGDLAAYARQNEMDESLFKAILRKLDFSRAQFAKDMQDFSDGQKKKVLLAKSLCEKAHLLVWDEPLNYIDVISRMQIETLLLTHSPTIIFVEHDRVFCEKIATKTVTL